MKPSCSSAPLSKQITMAFSWLFPNQNNCEAAAVLLIPHGANLRLSEDLKLLWEEIALPGDVRVFAYGSEVAGVNIRYAKTSRKTGRLQFASICDADFIKFLTSCRLRNPLQILALPKVPIQCLRECHQECCLLLQDL
eukprot:gb/GEZJ01003070.1/.p2 GENE.gb/GEZJ01003070.1/~~gb/GEZJ01003070.1/.p2  ORF type:complete len:138 (-),score=13.50 gb/GEZJ01003070.1/:4702-5115(-)